jgi:hypothetical protein
VTVVSDLVVPVGDWLDKLVVVRRNARKPQITFWLKASAILTAHRNVAIEGYRRPVRKAD